MKILVDLDDVLCNFIGEVFDLVGITEDDFMRRIPPLDCNWKVTELCGIPEDVIWEMIERKGYGFWASLKPHPWAEILWNALVNHWGKENVIVCTSPKLSTSCYAGKIDWVYKNLNTCNIILCPDKTMLNTGSILIDDSPYNVTHFGRNGILFPAINNSKRKQYLELKQHPIKVYEFLAMYDLV